MALVKPRESLDASGISVARWSPIEPLDMAALDVDFAEIDALNRQWLEVKARAEESDLRAYDQFNEELVRSWAIETGIIEGIYDLDSGITRTLIAKGFSVEFVERSATNKSPDDLIRILRDHRDAVDFIHCQIAKSRPLAAWFMRALHQVIAKNQPTYQAIDQFGRMFDTKLRAGEFKKLPNNPTRPDGAVHEYCPPEQVESELDNLINWYDEHAESCHPLAVGAWLHHRFTQIHPFADGNGRVVRALLTWHLVKYGFLPVVVTRDYRSEYIDALERADAGDLSPFARLLVKLERQTLLKALNVQHGVAPGVDTIDEVIGFIAEGVQKKKRAEDEALRSVQKTAVALRQVAVDLLDSEAERVGTRLESVGMQVTARTSFGGPDEGNEYYYKREVLQSAQDADHWVNFQEPRYFARVSIRDESRSRGPIMHFIISLHSVGRHLTGVMAATGFLIYRYPSQDERDDAEFLNHPDFVVCSAEPFLFTARDDAGTLKPRFENWARQGFSAALRDWGRRVIEQT